MSYVADNADLWAQPRQNIFFTAHNQTPLDGNLTGQCVTLVKWFMAEMSSVPSPFAARGDARYVGINLLAQGHAVKVPYEERRRGDIAVFEYGVYGHIGVMLDADRIFEQNVNVGGVYSKIVDGARVYASRIGRLSESWRTVRATIYRLNTYKEGNSMDNKTSFTDEQLKRTCLFARLAAGDSLEKANANNANDVKQIKANPDYLPALMEQIYHGNEVFRWKAAHYDEQVKASYDQGYLDGEAEGDTSEFEVASEVAGKPVLYTKKLKA